MGVQENAWIGIMHNPNLCSSSLCRWVDQHYAICTESLCLRSRRRIAVRPNWSARPVVIRWPPRESWQNAATAMVKNEDWHEGLIVQENAWMGIMHNLCSSSLGRWVDQHDAICTGSLCLRSRRRIAVRPNWWRGLLYFTGLHKNPSRMLQQEARHTLMGRSLCVQIAVSPSWQR